LSAVLLKEFSLSYNQEFFCMLDEGNRRGAFGNRHTLVGGWRLSGELDVPTLQAALDDVVGRHEILRTSIARNARPPYQLVHPAVPASLEVRQLPESADLDRDLHCEQVMTEVQAEPFNVAELPLLRAVLGRFDQHDSVLILTMHHIAGDAWSMQLVIRDLMACYARRRGFQVDLPALRQYRDYIHAQRDGVAPEQLRPWQDYWRGALHGARVFQLPIRPADPAGAGYAMHNFAITGTLATDLNRLAGLARCSPFMVLLSAFYLLAHQLTGETDLVVPPFTTGRNDGRFHDTVGPFLNYLPVRTELAGSQSFSELLTRTRASCLAGYAHDIPFELIQQVAPDLLDPVGPGRTRVAFEMVQSTGPAGAVTAIGDLSYTEVHTRLLADGDCPDIPNGMLWALNLIAPDELIGTVQFNRAEFDPAAVIRLTEDYRAILARVLADPHAPLIL
ncbi:MAG TPA: condensation domain-containing protein, partial [Jatrophihabitans sp.]|nr:condensation domain-containing protein [Jatrophihabitans sp.]